MKVSFTLPYCSSIFIESQFHKIVKINKKIGAYIIRAFANGLGSSYVEFIVSKLFYSFCFVLQNDYFHHSKLPSSRTLLTTTANIHIPFNAQTPYRIRNRMFKLSNMYDVKAVLWIT